MADDTVDARRRLKRLTKEVAQEAKKRRKLKKRVKRLERTVAAGPEAADAAPQVPTEPVVPSGRPQLSQPDPSWTVGRLREAATSRGLTGVSRMSKARLLEALTSTSEPSPQR